MANFLFFLPPFNTFFYLAFCSSLLFFPLLFERLTYGPSGTAFMHFPGLVSLPLLNCSYALLTLLRYWKPRWTFSSALSPGTVSMAFPLSL